MLILAFLAGPIIGPFHKGEILFLVTGGLEINRCGFSLFYRFLLRIQKENSRESQLSTFYVPKTATANF